MCRKQIIFAEAILNKGRKFTFIYNFPEFWN